MKKVLHIFFLCLMSLVALVANAQITSVSELNNTTTYTLKTTERGYFLYNEATSTEALTSSYNLDDGQNATPTDYYVCFDKAATHSTWNATSTERDVAKVSLNSPQYGLQEINTTNAHNVYNDMTSAEGFKVAPGEVVVPAIGYTASWMHGYVYVDLDQSKQFEVESVDAAELVTYNYHNGRNKAGSTVFIADAFKTPFPSFTAPSEPGTYRIRFKVDWENYDPAGAAGANGNGTGSQGIVANGGSVIDALMIVAEPPSVSYNVTFTYKQNGTVIGTTSQNVFEGDPVPAFSVPSYIEATVEGTLPETVTEDLNIVVNTTVKADCPFKMYASTDAEDVVWTALTLKRSPVLYLYATEDGTQISTTAVETLPTDETLKKYAWCFVGDWLNGFTINNLATGKRIASPSTALTDGTDYHAILTDATLEDGTDKFKLVTNSAGNYFIKRADTDNYFLSNFGGTTNTLLSFWNSGNALTDGGTGDGGSIFEVVAITLPEPVLNTLVPTVEPTTATGTLETITLNFEKAVTYDNTKTITLGNRMMGITKDITVAVSAEDAKVVTITLAEPVTEPGFLSLYIPEETFTATEDGTFNPELTSPITVLAPTNTFAFESTTPADNANLLELSTVKVTYADVPTLATEGASVDVINTETSTAVTTATVAYDAEDWNSVVFTLAAAITTPGTYTLTIPDEFIWNSQYNDIAEDKGVSQGATYTPATTLTFNVIEPYPVNFDKNMNSSRADRTLRSITLTEEGQAGQTVTVANTSKIYNDQHETTTLTCNAGSTLTATFNYSGTWMHGYVYIDTENDGAFSFNEGNTDQSGTDLKAFAFYSGNFYNDASGYNSAGQSISGDNRANINPPSFTAPTTPGTYRIRFKVDWNSVDPGGQKAANGTVTGDNGIAKNGGYILDATLEVTGSTTPEGPIAPVSITPEDQSEVESFTSATITFEEDVTYDELIEVTIAQRNGLYYQKATVSVDGATVTVSAPEEITEAGTYAISVPAGAFSTTDGRTNEAFTTMFTITEPAGPADTFVYTSAVPADGSEVAELSSITVTYPQWVCDYINETPFNVVDAESNVVTTASLTYNDNWEDVVIVLEEPITAEGTYTITVPAGYIYSNEGYDPSAADKGVSNGAIYNPEFTLTYTVKAASEPINTFVYKSVDPANESVVKELGDITITFPANVANEVTKTPINVINTEDGSTVTTATLGYPLGEGNDKVVLRLTEAVKTNGTYTITVPEGYIYDYDEAIYNPEFTLTYTVDTVNGISTVTIDSLEDKTIFTIDGRKVSGKLQRGAYIIDGQKKFVK